VATAGVAVQSSSSQTFPSNFKKPFVYKVRFALLSFWLPVYVYDTCSDGFVDPMAAKRAGLGWIDLVVK
jgi:hypothetical protein